MGQPSSLIYVPAVRRGIISLCAAVAGCSADVTRFDLGSPTAAEINSSNSASSGRDQNFGSAGSAEQGGGYQRPASTYSNSSYNSGVSKTELSPPQQPITTSAIQPDPYAGGRYVPPVANNAPQQRSPSYAPAPQASAASEKGEMLEVQQGDTLYKLSRKHQVSVAELMSVNGLSSPALKLGQKLYLPAGSKAQGHGAQPQFSPTSYETAAATAAPAAEAPGDWTGSYTVKQGDSLYAVARQNNVRLADLERYNGIADARKVKPGTVLKVPQGDRSREVASASSSAAKASPNAPATTPATVPPIAQNASQNGIPATSSSKQPTILNGSNSAPDQPEAERVAKADTPNVATDARPSGSVAGTSKLRWPLQGKVVSGFGQRSDGTHNDGVNVAAPMGTDVHAAEAGIVAYAGDELKGYGNLVLLRHDNGWVTAYAHGDEILVKRGDRVKRGQVIAKAGRSGQVDQPQLHFELRQGQKPVDPTPFMEKM